MTCGRCLSVRDSRSRCWRGSLLNVQKAIDERMKRLRELGDKMAAAGDPSLFERWPAIEQVLAARNEHRGNDRLRESFQEKTSKAIESAGKDYIAVIKGLSAEESEQGTAWLQGIVDDRGGCARRFEMIAAGCRTQV